MFKEAAVAGTEWSGRRVGAEVREAWQGWAGAH